MASGSPTLVLWVESRPPDVAETPHTATFGPDGGTVGRSSRCGLALPDPETVVSRQHVRITFQDGRFYAVDTSSNGLFINGATSPLGADGSAALQDGDRLGVGDYRLVVEIRGPADEARDAAPRPAGPEHSVRDNPFAPGAGLPREAAAPDPAPQPPPPDPEPERAPPAPPPPAASDDIAPGPDPLADGGDPLIPGGTGGDEPVIPEADDLVHELLGTHGGTSGRGQGRADPGPPAADHTPGWNTPIQDAIRPPDNIDPQPGPEPDPARTDARDHTDAHDDTDARDHTDALDHTGGARQETHGERTAPSPHDAGGRDAGDGLAAFCRGAGLDPSTLAHADAAETLERAGALFAAMNRGLVDLLHARTGFKREFRIERTMIGASDNNPLKTAPDAETALDNLLQPPARGYMAAGEAVDQAFDDLREHEVSVVAAMHRALQHVLTAFEPGRLERTLEGRALRDVLPGGRQARLWQLYRDHYATIASDAENVFAGELGREFVQAYENATARSGTGGRRES